MYSKQIKFIQINLQHFRVATNNLMKIIDDEKTDVLCLQETYVTQNKIVCIPRKLKIHIYGEGRHRAAIVVTNNQKNFFLLRQISDEGTLVLEAVSDKGKIIIASMYFDINRQIEDDLIEIEALIHHAKGYGILLAIDSKSRSASWHDNQTNSRGRVLEELLNSKHPHLMNEESKPY